MAAIEKLYKMPWNERQVESVLFTKMITHLRPGDKRYWLREHLTHCITSSVFDLRVFRRLIVHIQGIFALPIFFIFSISWSISTFWICFDMLLYNINIWWCKLFTIVKKTTHLSTNLHIRTIPSILFSEMCHMCIPYDVHM